MRGEGFLFFGFERSEYLSPIPPLCKRKPIEKPPTFFFQSLFPSLKTHSLASSPLQSFFNSHTFLLFSSFPSFELFLSLSAKKGKGKNKGEKERLLFGLEVIKQDATLLGFLAPVADDHAGAVDDFSGVAFAVENA